MRCAGLQRNIARCQHRRPQRGVHAAHHGTQRQMRHALLGQPRNMHEPSTRAHQRFIVRQDVHQPVQHVVADKRARRL